MESFIKKQQLNQVLKIRLKSKEFINNLNRDLIRKGAEQKS